MPLNTPLKDWSGRCVWLVGASSGIGQALAHALHARGACVVVSARREDKLQAFVQAHPGSHALPLDVAQADQVARAVPDVLRSSPSGKLDLVVYAAATYQPMRATAIDLPLAMAHQRINVDGAWHVLAAVVPVFMRQRQGHISLMASVAGYRGLPQSLVYGPTKAALINLAETLYLDLHELGIGVSLINPGFVETELTARNDFKMPAIIPAAQAAERILAGWQKGQFEIHFPRRFTWWMKAMHLLPARLYFALVRRITGL